MPTSMPLVLFPPFHPSTGWRAIDDRVRGGASQSYFEEYCGGAAVDTQVGSEKENLLEKGHGHGKECGVRFFGHLGGLLCG